MGHVPKGTGAKTTKTSLHKISSAYFVMSLPGVCVTVRPVHKGAGANRAGEGPLARVLPDVLVHVRLAGKRLVTVRTGVRLDAVMTVHVVAGIDTCQDYQIEGRSGA